MSLYKPFVCRFRTLVALFFALLAGPALGEYPGENFNRIELRSGLLLTQPGEGVDGWGVDLGLGSYWVVVPGLVAELGLGRQQENYHWGYNDRLKVVLQYGYYGGRVVLPPGSAVRLSVAARGFAGRLNAGDEMRWRSIGYYWLEVGAHFSPAGNQMFSATARQYQWADSTREWRATGEWLLGDAPWAWGFSMEIGPASGYLQGGVSLNHRF